MRGGEVTRTTSILNLLCSASVSAMLRFRCRRRPLVGCDPWKAWNSDGSTSSGCSRSRRSSPKRASRSTTSSSFRPSPASSRTTSRPRRGSRAAIRIEIPVVSAAMDTVTEAPMAIALAREGGIGVVHRNLSIAEQVAEVDRVKRSEAGMITEPVTLPPDALVRDALELMARYRISGVPIADADGKLVGILTNRDLRFERDEGRPVSELMTSRGLVTAPAGTTLERGRGDPSPPQDREAPDRRRRRPADRARSPSRTSRSAPTIRSRRRTGRVGFASRPRSASARTRSSVPARSSTRAQTRSCSTRRTATRMRSSRWRAGSRRRSTSSSSRATSRPARRPRRWSTRAWTASRSASGRGRSARPASWPAWAFRRSRRSTTARACARSTTCR